MNFTIFKSTPFETDDGVKGTHYTVIHKGRFLGINTLNHEADNLKVDGDKITVKGDLQVKPKMITDADTGKVITFIDLLPKFDLEVAVV